MTTEYKESMGDKMRILVNDATAKEALELLGEHHEVTAHHYELEELVEKIVDFDAILIRSATKLLDPRIFENGKSLKVIGRAGVGTDNIDVSKATSLGIPVVFAPTGAMISVAELTIGHMLALSRHIVKSTNSMKEGQWLKSKLKGNELYGKTLGLFGCGNIGNQTALLAQYLGMEVIYCDIVCNQELDAEQVPKEELLSRSDFLSMHLPKTPKTTHIISHEEFKLMKNTAFLINCARGGVVDEEALYEALSNGEIAGAALDVFEKEPIDPNNPLLKLDNIHFSPHLGASTKEAQIRAGTMTAGGILDVLAGENPKYCKNPSVLK